MKDFILDIAYGILATILLFSLIGGLMHFMGKLSGINDGPRIKKEAVK